MKILPFAAITAVALLPVAVQAADVMSVVGEGYARSTNPITGAAFMTVHNAGTADCTLTAASTAAADVTEIHTHLNDNGVMRMTKVEGGITVPAGAEHVFARGGEHIMLMGLKKPMSDGDFIPLSLDFGPCGTIETSVAVDNKRMDPMPAAGMSHEGMSH